MLHIFEAVDAEWDTEAGPEHGEAENAGGRPGHHAWSAGGCSRHARLKEDVK